MGFLKVKDKNSRIRIRMHWSEARIRNPHPYQNATNPQHWFQAGCFLWGVAGGRKIIRVGLHNIKKWNFFNFSSHFSCKKTCIRNRNSGKSVCRYLLNVSSARWYSLSARSNSLESVLTCSRVTPIPVRSFALLQLVNLIPAPGWVIKRRRSGRRSSLSYLKESRNRDCSVFTLPSSTACVEF